MLEKRVETISDDGWKKIIEDFQKLHENEERMERQLELEEAHKQVEEAHKQVEQKNQEIKQMIQLMFTNGMSLEFISKSLSKSEDEIRIFLLIEFLVAFLKKSLHGILSFDIIIKQCPGGEIGRRSGLKIHR